MELWLLYAILGSVFAGVTAVLAKIGIKGVNSHLATAVRTSVVVVFSWIIVLIVGSHLEIVSVSGRTWAFLIASGLATGASWLCFFYALKFGTVSNVSPLKKSSTVLTIILAFIILGDPLGLPQILGMVFIIAGTVIMLEKEKGAEPHLNEKSGNWLLEFFGNRLERAKMSRNQGAFSHAGTSFRRTLVFGMLAAVFASLVTIFGALGVADIDADLGNAIRVLVVLIASWGLVLFTGNQKGISSISKKSWVFLLLSGLATGGSWLFFFRALQTGPVSAIVPIDKLSIIFNILFAAVFLKEKQSLKRVAGLACLVIGTLVLVMMY